jgi:hypothetical protein
MRQYSPAIETDFSIRLCFGQRIADFTAPVSGVVIYIRAVPSLKKGDSVIDIGEIVEDPGK